MIDLRCSQAACRDLNAQKPWPRWCGVSSPSLSVGSMSPLQVLRCSCNKARHKVQLCSRVTLAGSARAPGSSAQKSYTPRVVSHSSLSLKTWAPAMALQETLARWWEACLGTLDKLIVFGNREPILTGRRVRCWFSAWQQIVWRCPACKAAAACVVHPAFPLTAGVVAGDHGVAPGRPLFSSISGGAEHRGTWPQLGRVLDCRVPASPSDACTRPSSGRLHSPACVPPPRNRVLAHLPRRRPLRRLRSKCCRLRCLPWTAASPWSPTRPAPPSG